MHEASLPKEPSDAREVEWRGRKVRVLIWYGVNIGPEDTGFNIIPDLGRDPSVRGFPVIKAAAVSSGYGYENNLGWIQVVAHLDDGGSILDWSHDSFPALRDRGVPFVVFGYNPTFFDAPFWPERPKIRWRADLFLCPLVVRRRSEEAIFPLTGFRWGFEIASEGDAPRVSPLVAIGHEAWGESLPRLRFAFPGWRFAEWPASR
jgi:hypothetical protein